MSPLVVVRLRGVACLVVGLIASMAPVAPGFAAEPKCYVINEIQVTDAAQYKVYAEQVPATLTPYGGVIFVRGGNAESISGAPVAGRIVIVEFPGRASAKAWHESPEYQKILTIRNASSTSRVYYVDGVAP
jgi:uncharacterized protein (DUF1330 family)